MKKTLMSELHNWAQTCLLPRVDADVEYQAVADEWIKQLYRDLKGKRVPTQSTQTLQQTQSGTTDAIESSIYHRDAPYCHY